ncbi:hypothetical protein ASE17_18580 [Phenylobacterium sp. Root77]|uniref:DUF1365 domain-containing protein n=1 Tax=unclassified Phenylobacterium TaxID=2640670 RepID=UPI0006FD4D98|nr:MULTISPECIES: DUF1365 domain-containing protein [unclassified Phenylobacterium]KQW70865.1 hypothetical protein ASC73_12450 [Phenylobacterium sp. Root1277]KQW90714.1 hypothetical protein ASC79_15140 [Phenylobacterium sp. Root1290]KRC39654.1 hypothetical protein ASE17_18580 [Phenylobacterium sp. Root77]
MSGPASGLYAGVVTHARRRPRRHRLRYRIFMLLLDLEEMDGLAARLKLFALRRLALTSFHPGDHLSKGAGPLKAQVEEMLSRAGLPHGGPIRLLCMPRILGGAFNPLSVYFCHDADGALSAVLYEVNNTFGERHAYLIAAAGDGGLVRQQCDKQFYVSPFMDMELTYRFKVAPPGDSVGVAIEVDDAEGTILSAGFHARRRELTDANLLGAWIAHPMMTLGVMWAIHWEALWIWAKGERLRPRPSPPLRFVTLGAPTGH